MTADESLVLEEARAPRMTRGFSSGQVRAREGRWGVGMGGCKDKELTTEGGGVRREDEDAELSPSEVWSSSAHRPKEEICGLRKVVVLFHLKCLLFAGNVRRRRACARTRVCPCAFVYNN